VQRVQPLGRALALAVHRVDRIDQMDDRLHMEQRILKIGVSGGIAGQGVAGDHLVPLKVQFVHDMAAEMALRIGDQNGDHSFASLSLPPGAGPRLPGSAAVGPAGLSSAASPGPEPRGGKPSPTP
jgi:hypothetical protein